MKKTTDIQRETCNIDGTSSEDTGMIELFDIISFLDGKASDEEDAFLKYINGTIEYCTVQDEQSSFPDLYDQPPILELVLVRYPSSITPNVASRNGVSDFYQELSVRFASNVGYRRLKKKFIPENVSVAMYTTQTTGTTDLVFMDVLRSGKISYNFQVGKKEIEFFQDQEDSQDPYEVGLFLLILQPGITSAITHRLTHVFELGYEVNTLDEKENLLREF